MKDLEERARQKALQLAEAWGLYGLAADLTIALATFAREAVEAERKRLGVVDGIPRPQESSKPPPYRSKKG